MFNYIHTQNTQSETNKQQHQQTKKPKQVCLQKSLVEFYYIGISFIRKTANVQTNFSIHIPGYLSSKYFI